MTGNQHGGCPIVVLISAGSEWKAVEEYYSARRQDSPLGDWFEEMVAGQRVAFLHGGWGKVAAAASTQYAIDWWHPGLLINLGTCGGFAGQVERGEILLVDETLVYDIYERMGDANAALAHYTTRLELDWLKTPYPQQVRRGRLISADADIDPEAVPFLVEHFQAIAADWESGAIAWVAGRNGVRCLILRGVTDLVSRHAGEAYGAIEVFQEQAKNVMLVLLAVLPDWIENAIQT
jgi:adenosylhomocysteine nucleosidase